MNLKPKNDDISILRERFSRGTEYKTIDNSKTIIRILAKYVGNILILISLIFFCYI